LSNKYGEFFPIELSPFFYNDTVAQEHFPLPAKDASKMGYFWQEEEERKYNITLKTKDIPDHIKDLDDLIAQALLLTIKSIKTPQTIITTEKSIVLMNLRRPTLRREKR
jgi:hypothetical protein